MKTFLCFHLAFFILFLSFSKISTTYQYTVPLPGTPLNKEEYEKYFRLLMPEPMVKSLCAQRLVNGCEKRTIRRFDAYENHGVVPTGPVCTDLKTVSRFDSFCDFARFRCLHGLHYIKRIPCEDNELMTIQTPAATSENDLSFKSTPPQEISTNNNQHILTELKAKRNIIGQQRFKTLEEPEYIEEVSDDDNIGFAGPQNTPSSGAETTAVTHKPTSYQQATPKRENVKVKHNAYEMAWTKLKPANNKETTPKPQATEEALEDSITDDDLRGFAMPHNSPSDETNTAMQKPTKAKGFQLEMPTKNNGAQKSFDGLNKPNSYELPWAKLIKKHANNKETTPKPKATEETSEDSDIDDDLRGFAMPHNSPSDETNTAMPKPSKARSIQLEMPTKKNGAQKSFDGLNKPNSYELAWSKLKPANDNHKITTKLTKPQDNEETDRSDDIRGFLGPPN